MSISRRDFLLAGSALAGAALAVPRVLARQQPPLTPRPPQPGGPRQVTPADVRYFEWKKVGEGAHAAFGEGGNALAVVGPRETLLIDTKNTGFGDTLRTEAVTFGSLVGLVINTHHHGDHTGGNCAFTKDVPVLAHEKCKARIAGNVERYVNGAKNTVRTMYQSKKLSARAVRDSAMLLAGTLDELKDPAKVAALFEPTKTTAGNETLTLDGRKIELVHVGAGHTDNDLIVFLPDANVLHTGDLVFHNWWPYIDRGAGADTAGWIRSCEKIVEMCDDKTVVVPGHGEITDRAGVRKQIEFFTTMRANAAKAVKDGTTREAFLAMTFGEYENFAEASKFIRPTSLGGLYDEAAGTPAE